ncbi:WD40-repeat-containing domain protein [Zychaea mexicana]|uniref:WD40-repeat-containing domain protein n=1 Tax=Zychaea mexicana TaxID=64656 RepID=UPI0022FF2AEA|nr:WD40-repeat-containing domain protein [Zychaea mexicana]KAI9489752.1 WD40-repeat-containing domain protein [Zychaea mexicana]
MQIKDSNHTNNHTAADAAAATITTDSQQSNGKSSVDASPDMLGRVKKEELVRLILQSLNDLGYRDAAGALQKDSGIALETDTITRFRGGILSGDWRLAESLLATLPGIQTNDLLQAQFLIRQQKFLELLEAQKTMKALHVLRNELTPLGQSIERLHQLSSLIFCSSVEDIKSQAQWDGAGGTSRQQLLVDLQNYIPPSIMIPNERLLTLINQAYEWQRRGCLYHSDSTADFSLFADHVCDKSLFPSSTIRILEGHTDEVWHLSFSNSGRYLTSVSKDKTCIVWDMTTFEKVQILAGQDECASYCAWSPDDSKLLVCGIDTSLVLWDPLNGNLLHTYTEHKDQVTSCVWLPDGEHFISGACDTTLCLWHIDGRIQNTWPAHRTVDMKITPDGRRLVTISFDKYIGIYDLDDLKLMDVGKISENEMITSLTITKDGRYALTNVQDSQELHLWDLDEQQLVRKYSGQKQKSFVIRSTLGGDDESFVLSGSEDNCVYVWSREHQTLLEVLEGHTGTVNCVSWCPVGLPKFASASDDQTIRIWGLPNEAQNGQDKIHV